MLHRVYKISAFTILLIFAIPTHAEPDNFNRFTDELTQTLESDAASVMVRGFTFETAAQLCKRVPGPAGETLTSEYLSWKTRNNEFILASTQVLNEIGDRLVSHGGEPEKQSYFRYVIENTASVAMQRISTQFGGANLNNELAPSEQACSGFSKLLHDGTVDYKNNPHLTRALLAYINRKNKP